MGLFVKFVRFTLKNITFGYFLCINLNKFHQNSLWISRKANPKLKFLRLRELLNHANGIF